MKTEISRFCESYLRTVSTLPPVLTAVAETIDTPEHNPLLDGPLATLNDIRARLRSLVEKIESQQAYLLIFGPLKSGKSTLMNAISGAYVSEVTSLPGYPCLVYVRHSEDSRFSVTRYNGRESVFPDGRVLKEVIADSHIALAEQIRRTEEAGIEFDPRTNFSEAIRRADVNIPVQSLAESGTVLVDTPGLYSRMKFGYDVLAREFRASASCAVFVVKTDNLFLEQVFAEFNQLLGLFSRIFLVINVDSQKRDLQPDGSFRPSAESQNPEQIIEAFKTLSMAGPMRQAYKEGRLRMHAVDLLNAASSFLSRNGSGAGDPERQQFNAFLTDLTDYLNSSDYTQEFIRDSLRQGESLCLEARGVCDGETITELSNEQERLAAEMKILDDRIAAVDRLLGADWAAAFAKVSEENAAAGAEKSGEVSTRLVTEMREALDRWSNGEESLRALGDVRWNPLLTGAGRTLAVETRCRLHRLLGTPLGGAEPAAATMTDLHVAGLKVTAVAEPARLALDEALDNTPYLTAIEQEDVPVRKSFVDWMLFRRIQTVRRRLFGEDSAQTIPADIKLKRLPEVARAAFLDLIDTAVKEKFPKLPATYSDALLAAYVAKFRAGVMEQLRALREELASQRAARQTPFDANQRILASIHELKEHAAKVLTEIDVMTQQETRRPLTQSPAPLSDPEALATPTPAWECSAA